MTISLQQLIATLEMIARMQDEHAIVEINGSTEFTVAYNAGTETKRPRVKITTVEPAHD